MAAHLVADVPVSSFLSGGLDSSIVTVLAHRAAQEIDAYTITFRPEDQRLEAMPDDAIYARKVAAQFGIKLHEIEISPDIVDLLPRMVDALDEPIGDPAAINTLLMCEAARERGVKVHPVRHGRRRALRRLPQARGLLMAGRTAGCPGRRASGVRFAVDRSPVSVGGRGLRYARWAKRFLTFAELPEEPRFRRSYTLYDPDELSALVSPDLTGHVDQVMDEHRQIYHDNSLRDEVNRMCLADTRLFLPGLNLAYTDRASMAASVEVRVPFVDPVVARAAFSIGGSDKIRRRKGKIALKRAAESWLPREIVYRPKASFSAPLRAWVRNDLQEIINDVLVRRGARGLRDDPGRRAAAPDRRRAGRPRGPGQADMAAAHARAVVPQRTVRRRGGLTGEDDNEADSSELQIRGTHGPRCPGSGVPSRRRPRAVAVLAHLHRHGDDEGDRGQAVDGGKGAGPSRPGAQGPRHGGAAGGR